MKKLKKGKLMAKKATRSLKAVPPPEAKDPTEVKFKQIPDDLKKLAGAHELFNNALKLLNTGMFQRGHMEFIERTVAGLTPIVEDLARQIHAHPDAALILEPKPVAPQAAPEPVKEGA